VGPTRSASSPSTGMSTALLHHPMATAPAPIPRTPPTKSTSNTSYQPLDPIDRPQANTDHLFFSFRDPRAQVHRASVLQRKKRRLEMGKYVELLDMGVRIGVATPVNASATDGGAARPQWPHPRGRCTRPQLAVPSRRRRGSPGGSGSLPSPPIPSR
jgi:hypothetical protein